MNRDGPLSLGDIGSAFGDSPSHSLSELYHDNPYYTDAPSSGEISIGDFINTSAGVQYGQVLVTPGVVYTVSFPGEFSDVPCLFFTHVLSSASKTDYPYIESVTTTGFTIKSMGNIAERVHWLAVIPNYPNTNTYGGLNFSCQRKIISNGNSFSVDYGNTSFTSAPVILCNIQNDNCGTGTNAFHIRWDNTSLTTTGVTLLTEYMSQVSSTQPLPASPSTSVGVLAIEQGTGSNPFVKTVISEDIVTHSTSYTLNLGGTYPEVTVIGNCTIDGGDASAVAITGQTSSSVTVTVQEASTRDGSHTDEKVSLIAFGKTCQISGVSGGTATDVTIGSDTYRIHAFTTVGTSTFHITETMDCDVLLVAGGGGGGGVTGNGASGGGGAGGLVFNTFTALQGQQYTINVGNGGTAGGNALVNGGNGGNTTGFGLTAKGGGGGGGSSDGSLLLAGSAGGSGGGGGGGDITPNGAGGASTQPGTNSGVTTDAGFAGGASASPSGDCGGGGGGAGEVGDTFQGYAVGNGYNIQGGDGLNMSSYFTTAFGDNGYFAGGGGAFARNDNIPRAGGLGGGGAGGSSGSVNTGGGGGGRDGGVSAGAGGSGIVLIRYRID
jgi:hypothetical protein|uniref:Glycine-rich domain-containing protein n=1 Tax=viral metagenome TaxID=1070528 RepID=A0A6C0JDD1_9ZZZZ